MRFHLDVGRLDERPPFLDFDLLEGGERRRRLLLARCDVQAEVGKTSAHDGIVQGSDDHDIEPDDHLLGRASGHHRPCQNEMYMPGAAISSVVGTSGNAGQRVLAMTAKAFNLPPRTVLGLVFHIIASGAA